MLRSFSQHIVIISLCSSSSCCCCTVKDAAAFSMEVGESFPNDLIINVALPWNFLRAYPRSAVISWNMHLDCVPFVMFQSKSLDFSICSIFFIRTFSFPISSTDDKSLRNMDNISSNAACFVSLSPSPSFDGHGAHWNDEWCLSCWHCWLTSRWLPPSFDNKSFSSSLAYPSTTKSFRMMACSMRFTIFVTLRWNLSSFLSTFLASLSVGVRSAFDIYSGRK